MARSVSYHTGLISLLRLTARCDPHSSVLLGHYYNWRQWRINKEPRGRQASSAFVHHAWLVFADASWHAAVLRGTSDSHLDESPLILLPRLALTVMVGSSFSCTPLIKIYSKHVSKHRDFTSHGTWQYNNLVCWQYAVKLSISSLRQYYL